ncbi:sigma-70 family RNA polymerase sigma factor [Zhenhengia yiwuensis]|uniref:sigma-70 family RNA polymerase sigma factor n=1 Tax=Zhenhengia yiwuensis TaxID=2763666 RepID=UPI002A76346A|nr:sigma-70 family RNA polymerase sigma factor [Zhenhengia yiwuensis]MDY3369402.1 sigma-70 family RNA polymerase sigma factor [Zhenhengia yiwuensis]
MTNEELFRLGDYDTLYTRNLPFMHKFAKRFSNLPIEMDDLMGCGHIAFVKALETYNADKSKWLTYFSKFMINEILMLNRKVLRQSNCISLETVMITNYEDKEIRLEHQISSGIFVEDTVIDKVTVEQLFNLTKTLPTREREALRLHLLGTRQAVIGKRLNVSQACVSRMIRKITEELYKQYQKGA